MSKNELKQPKDYIYGFNNFYPGDQNRLFIFFFFFFFFFKPYTTLLFIIIINTNINILIITLHNV